MAAETTVRFRVVGDNIEVLDRAGNLIDRVNHSAESAASGGLSRMGGAVVTLNQGLELLGRAADFAARGVGMLTAQLDQADAIGKMAQSYGLATRTLSEYRVATGLAGVELDAFGKALGILSRNVIEAQEGVGKTAGIFRAAGIDIKAAGSDVNLALEGVADLFQKMPDGPTKTAIAYELLGKSAAGMIPLLNGGSEALRSARAEAIALGAAFDDGTSKAAEQFNDNLTRLKIGVEGLALAVAQELLPDLVRATDSTVAFAEANQKIVAHDIAGWARGAATAIEKIADAYGKVAHAIDVIMSFPGTPIGDIPTATSESWDAVARRLDSSGENMSVDPLMSSGAPDVRASAQLRANLNQILAQQDQQAQKAAKVNEETAKTAALTKDTALGYNDVVSGIQRATDETTAWGETFSNSVLSVFDALLANDGKFDLLDVGLRTLQRTFLETFSEKIPSFVQQGADAVGGIWQRMLGNLSTSTTNNTQAIAGALRNSPVGDISGIALNGQSLSYGGGYGMSLADGYGAMSMADGTIGISSGAGANAIAGSQGAAAGGGGMAAIGGAAGIAGLILLGIQSGAAGIGAAHDVAANGGTAREQKAAFQGALLNTATMGILPESLGRKVPSEMFNTFFGPFGMGPLDPWSTFFGDDLYESLGIIKKISKSDARRAGVSAYLADIGLARTPAVNWGGNDNVKDIPIDPAMRAEYGNTLGAIGFLSGFEGDRANKEFVESMLRRQSIIGENSDLMRGDLRYMAKESGVTLGGAVHTLTQQYIQGFDESGIESQQQYQDMLKGTIDLLAVDLPNGVDAYKIALNSMVQTNRGALVDQEKFEKSLKETVDLAGSLQNNLTGGVSGALGGQVSSILNGGNMNIGAMTSALNQQIVGGVSNLAVGQITNAITNSDTFKNWNGSIFSAVQSGDPAAFATAMAQTPDIIEMMRNGVEGLLPIFRQLGQIVEDVANSDPQPFYDRADAIERSRDDYLFGVSRPGKQRGLASASASQFKTAYDAAMRDGFITAKELDELGILGQTAIAQNSAVQGQYAQGSRQFNKQTDVITSIYDMLHTANVIAGDTADFKNIRGNTLTVGNLIVENTDAIADEIATKVAVKTHAGYERMPVRAGLTDRDSDPRSGRSHRNARMALLGR